MAGTTITVPHDLQHGIEVISRQTGKEEDGVVREALQEYLDRHQPPPRSIGVIKESEIRAAEIEEWLATNWRPT